MIRARGRKPGGAASPKPSPSRGRKIDPAGGQAHALVFAALGDETRLALVTRLSDGERHSIAELSEYHEDYARRSGAPKLTRQSITKHLRVLERARLVHAVQQGRESLFFLDAMRIVEMKAYLANVSAHWEDALVRLKAFVEEA